MFNWLKRLFGGSDSAPAEASQAPPTTPAPPPTPSAPPADAATGDEEPPAAGPA